MDAGDAPATTDSSFAATSVAIAPLFMIWRSASRTDFL
jgi:hypothetical protein